MEGESREVKDKTSSQSISSKRRCPECEGDRFISDYENAEIVCRDLD